MGAMTDVEARVRADSAPERPPATAGRLRAAWTAVSGAMGFVAGLAPHVLHHVGPLIGTALVAGAGGTAVFAVIGLAASIPLLLRLRGRFRSWWAPGVALAVSGIAFALSTVVIGPLISEQPSAPTTPAEHAQHH